MPPSTWTTTEQSTFLQSYMDEYLSFTEGKDYHVFWTNINAAWFAKWPECAAALPGVGGPLMAEQEAQVGKAINSRKKQIQTWFCWRANASRRSRATKKTVSAFDKVLKSKQGRVLSEQELFSHEYYDECVKPVIEAQKEAGNISSRGEALNIGRQLSKELLNAADEEVKAKIKKMYSLQKKKANDEQPLDPATIQQAIDELPFALAEIGALIRRCTGFAVSFVCAGPDPSKNWEITSMSCHPDITPQGNTFAHLYPTENNAMVTAFHDFAEVLFPVNQRHPSMGTTVANSTSSADRELKSDNRGDNQAEQGPDDETALNSDAQGVGTGKTIAGEVEPGGENQQDDSEEVGQFEKERTAHRLTLHVDYASHDEGDASVDLGDVSFGFNDASYRLGNASFGLGDTSFPLDGVSFGLGEALYLQTQATMANVSQNPADTDPINYALHPMNPTRLASGTHAAPTQFFDPLNVNVTPNLPSIPSTTASSGSCGSSFVGSSGGVGNQTFCSQWDFSRIGVGMDLPPSNERSTAIAPTPAIVNPQPSAGEGEEPRLPAPPTFSQSSAIPVPDTSTATVGKRRPRPRVIKQKTAVQDASTQEKVNPIAMKGAPSMPLVLTSPDVPQMTPAEFPNTKTPSPSVIPPTASDSQDHPGRTANVLSNASDVTEHRASKRVPKKSMRNETANAIGSNRPSFVERGACDEGERTQKPTSRKGKRSSDEAQGKATKKPKGK